MTRLLFLSLICATPFILASLCLMYVIVRSRHTSAA